MRERLAGQSMRRKQAGSDMPRKETFPLCKKVVAGAGPISCFLWFLLPGFKAFGFSPMRIFTPLEGKKPLSENQGLFG